ncbi:MAG: PxKF domain-containing protein, partial [bacterium]
PDGLEVYVTNSLSGTVSVLSPVGSPLNSAIAVGSQPYGIGTDGVYIYVAVMNSGKITVIERANHNNKTDIPAPFPVGFGKFVNPAMKIATVMSLSFGSDSITLGSTAPFTATATLQRKNNGAPVAGASIMFSVDGSLSGTAVTGSNGTAQWSFAASTLAVGTHTVTATFSESTIGGNVYVGSQASRSFSVRYAFAWLRPTNGSTNGVNAGSTVPVNWSIRDANGVAVTYLGVVTEISSAPCASGSSSAAKSASARANSAGNSDLRYNSAHFVFNWKTEKAWAGSCRQFTVSLSDGSSHSLAFQFR